MANIHTRVQTLVKRMHDQPQYRNQGAVLFIDLENQRSQTAYLPKSVFEHFLGNRGANMYLLYNLMQPDLDPLDPQIPLIFGTGPLSGLVPGATRGNVTSLSPDSRALLDSSAGDYFPSYMRHHGYEHLVLYGEPKSWTLLQIEGERLRFLDAAKYLGMDNIELTEAIEKDFDCKERKTLTMARITSAGENQVLTSGIMGGPKSIWARGGPGAKMGSLKVKAIMVMGRPPSMPVSKDYKQYNKVVSKKILDTSVTKNALKKVGTPFLYKPSRVLGALGTKNNQITEWGDGLDADNFDPYRPGMDGCYKCPVHCRAQNDMLPGGKGGWGADALNGLSGNASYDKAQSKLGHEHGRTYNGVNNDGKFDKYDKGDGPEYVTVGKFGPNIGIETAEQVLRINNILNDLGLDSASTGGALAWAMELYQRGIIDKQDTGGLELTWGNYPVIEKLLFMTAKREGFGNVIADSSRAVEKGWYPQQALDYRMAVKGLFQSDPHDSRILKAFALGLSVATRGMDHLRNRVTLEINARINDDAAFKTDLYGGTVAAKPNAYDGKEYAVRRCEDTFASGDAVGMCRFNTKLFNSPTLPDCEDFALQLEELTGLEFSEQSIQEIGKNITGLEHMINFAIGLRGRDDTLPRRWFDEGNTFGPFKGERIDRESFADMKARFYQVSGLNAESLPKLDWHRRLSQVTKGYAVEVKLPTETPGAPENAIIIDEPVRNIGELRAALKRKLPEAAAVIEDHSLGFAVNDEPLLSGEQNTAVNPGDKVVLVPVMAGG